MTRVVARPRLHMGLFDLGTSTPRVFGGIGVCLEKPETILTAVKAVSSSVVCPATLGAEYNSAISEAIDRLAQSTRGVEAVRIEIVKSPAPHIGLGSKTTLILAALASINAELGLGLGKEDLQRLCGRGGTSGIGVNTFFHGGLIIDGGHLHLGPRTFQPSSSSRPLKVPPVIVSVAMPKEWEVTLFLPDGPRRSSQEEREFFTANTPINNSEIDRVVSLAFMSIATAVVECDLHTFAKALRAMQANGFKRLEVESQSRTVKNILAELGGIPNVASGMSSMGPLVFSITNRFEPEVKKVVIEIAKSYDAETIGTFDFYNNGYSVV